MTHNKKTLKASINTDGLFKEILFDKLEMYEGGRISFKDSSDGVLFSLTNREIHHMTVWSNTEKVSRLKQAYEMYEQTKDSYDFIKEVMRIFSND